MPNKPAPTPTPTPPRLASLDAYRGLIMFSLLCGGMFRTLKDHPTWHWLHTQTEHVDWIGCVYWDLIQPAFMFMVGVAMPLAFARRASQGASWLDQWKHAVLRSLLLMVIGILLDHFGAQTIQIGFIRVLQQIAIGYSLAFFLLGRSLHAQAITTLSILIAYHCLWMFNPWNGPGGPWAQGNQNIGSALDLWLLGRNYSHLYVGLNAIPSTATILMGVMAGQWIQSPRPPTLISRGLFLAGLAGILAGWAVSPWFPWIKRIWTPSFALYAGGWTTLFLAAFHWIIDVRGWKSWSFPLIVVGTNSITAYIIANAFGGWFRSLSSAWIAPLQPVLGATAFPILQQALFALFAWLILWWMYRRKLFLKV